LQLLEHDTPWIPSSPAGRRYADVEQCFEHPRGAKVLTQRRSSFTSKKEPREGIISPEEEAIQLEDPARFHDYHFSFTDFGKYSHWGAPDADAPRSPREAPQYLPKREVKKQQWRHTGRTKAFPVREWRPEGFGSVTKKEKKLIKRVTATEEQHAKRIEKAQEGKEGNWRKPKLLEMDPDEYLYNPMGLRLEYLLSPKELEGGGKRIDRGATPGLLGVSGDHVYHSRVDRPSQGYIHQVSPEVARKQLKSRPPAKSTKPIVKSWRSIQKEAKKTRKNEALIKAIADAQAAKRAKEREEASGKSAAESERMAFAEKAAKLTKAKLGALASTPVSPLKKEKPKAPPGTYKGASPLDLDEDADMSAALAGAAPVRQSSTVFEQVFEKEEPAAGPKKKLSAKNYEQPFGADPFLSSSSDEEDVPFRSGTYMGALYNAAGRKKEDLYTRMKFILDEGATIGKIGGFAADHMGNYDWEGQFLPDDLTLTFSRKRDMSKLNFEGRKLEKGAFSGLWFPDKIGGEPGRFVLRRGKHKKDDPLAVAMKKKASSKGF